MEFGPQNGVCVKWVRRRSGPGAEHRRRQRQVQVLDEDDVAVAGGFGGGVGEGHVHGLVGLPRLAAPTVEPRATGRSKSPWYRNQRVPFDTTS